MDGMVRNTQYAVVINLAPCSMVENSLKDEEATVTGLGMKYIHIPLNFFNPTEADFHRFVDAMKSASGEKIWVHCAANVRASSFVFRYRCRVLGEDESIAVWNLREIWEPFGSWKKFVYGESRI